PSHHVIHTLSLHDALPICEFETLCAIQVTALLSCIALYFSTSKPELQYATTSDKIFIFCYVMITTLLGTSILKYVMYRKSFFLKDRKSTRLNSSHVKISYA